MATINATAIYTALREVLTTGTGTLRIVPIGTVKGELYEGLDDVTKSARATDAPRVEPTIRRLVLSGASPVRYASKALIEMEIDIRAVYHIGPEQAVNDDERHAVKAECIEDGGLIRQALEYPGNLTQTAAATATGIVSGMLLWESTELIRVQLESELPGLIEVLHVYTGTANIAQATS